MQNTTGEQNALTVYFDGSCPLCRREVAWYKNQRGADAIVWKDVSSANHASLEQDLHPDDAMRRFHVRKSDGKLISGAIAFAELWRNLPAFKLAGSFVGLPLIRNFAEIVYRLFLKVRPLMQRACD